LNPLNGAVIYFVPWIILGSNPKSSWRRRKNEQLCIYYRQMRRAAADFEEPTPINTA
jgi:hypothetical protein